MRFVPVVLVEMCLQRFLETAGAESGPGNNGTGCSWPLDHQQKIPDDRKTESAATILRSDICYTQLLLVCDVNFVNPMILPNRSHTGLN